MNFERKVVFFPFLIISFFMFFTACATTVKDKELAIDEELGSVVAEIAVPNPPNPSDYRQTPAEKQSPNAIVNEPAPEIPDGSSLHTVWIWQETKDCLWKLAKEYYGDPWRWKKIYMANRNLILDPNVIYPKQKIIIPAIAKN